MEVSFASSLFPHNFDRLFRRTPVEYHATLTRWILKAEFVTKDNTYVRGLRNGFLFIIVSITHEKYE